MTSRFRTAVLAGPGRIEIEERPLLAPEPGQVRIRLEGCGVCGSNLPVWEGRPWFTYPLPAGKPGHEGWGIIDAVGADVTHLKPGDRVAALSQNAFAEYDYCPASEVVALPDSVAPHAFPGEALGCAMNVFRRSDIQPHHHVAIVGLGFLGALLTQLAARTGARVHAISRRPFAREIAKKMGATTTLGFDDAWTTLEEIKRLTDRAGCERVIEATGLQAPLDLATEITAERGRLIIAGYHQDGLRQVNMQLWNWRGLDVINAHERDPRIYLQGVQEAAAAVAEGRLDPNPLYTHRFALYELPRALNHMRDRNEGFLKALVTYA
ncbi:MAG TPA: zinc-binding dehydrogenase [Opitutus sp.]|nr:zinc-binding dehydrogenase [Opitutus sp.]